MKSPTRIARYLDSPKNRRTRSRHTVGLATFLVTAALLAGGAGSSSAASSYDPSGDGYSMAGLAAQMGASTWWDAGYTGAGIDVAVIDTGVTQVPALAGAGKVRYGPDLSLESQTSSLRNLDSYGHGTFMAGLIAGHDPALAAPYSQAPATAYRGIAPDAGIVSVKVGTTDGGADVTQVIAAIDWVVQHSHDPGFNIRVINLSYGTNSSQSYTVDPLAYAAEQAWKHGIVVVAAAGNTGYQRGHGAPGLADPAYDPYIIGVGGYDTHGTAALGDDTMGTYSASSSGDGGSKNPDFVAPGSHLQGLRVPGSYIDLANPGGVLDGSYMRGSGTSEATAITSGAVALILQKYPNLTPDQVKELIQAGAQKLPGTDDQAQGAGELELAAIAADAPQGYPKQPTPLLAPGPGMPMGLAGTAGATGGKTLKAGPVQPVLQPSSPPTYAQAGPPPPAARYPDSSGTGSLELSRGSDHLTEDGKVLTGSIDIFGSPFNVVALAQAESQETAWSGGTFNGNAWSGNSWSGNSWSGNSWSGNSWSGNSWSGNSWSGNSWSGNSWSGNSWSGNSWSGNSWSSGTWSSSGWLGAGWD
jgi:serine protease AprX